MPDLTRLVFFQTPSPSPRSLAFVLSSSTMVLLVRLVRPIVMYAGHVDEPYGQIDQAKVGS